MSLISPLLFFFFYPLFYLLLSLPFPSVPSAENKNGLGTEAMPQIEGIRVFVDAACNFGFSQ